MCALYRCEVPSTATHQIQYPPAKLPIEYVAEIYRPHKQGTTDMLQKVFPHFAKYRVDTTKVQSVHKTRYPLECAVRLHLYLTINIPCNNNQCFCFQKQCFKIEYALVQRRSFEVMKINIFLGDLNDNSAIKESLTTT